MKKILHTEAEAVAILRAGGAIEIVRTYKSKPSATRNRVSGEFIISHDDRTWSRAIILKESP